MKDKVIDFPKKKNRDDHIELGIEKSDTEALQTHLNYEDGIAYLLTMVHNTGAELKCIRVQRVHRFQYVSKIKAVLVDALSEQRFVIDKTGDLVSDVHSDIYKMVIMCDLRMPDWIEESLKRNDLLVEFFE